MSDTVWLAMFAFLATFIGSIPSLMTAYAGLQQSKENAKKTDANTLLTAATNKKVEEVGEQTKEIHTATNGTLSKLEERADAQTKEISELRVIIKTLVEREAAAAPVRATAVRQTGELIEEVRNGNTVATLIEKIADLNTIMEGFKKEGMPVIAPAGEPLPVVAVKASEAKK